MGGVVVTAAGGMREFDYSHPNRRRNSSCIACNHTDRDRRFASNERVTLGTGYSNTSCDTDGIEESHAGSPSGRSPDPGFHFGVE